MDPIVVLGSRVTVGRPGALLEERLNKAMQIARPGQLFIVSGAGESRAMADYLRARGVHHLIEEGRATSTNENLENAWALANGAERLIVVTNNFHALRTRLWAWHLRIPARVIEAPTPRHLKFRNYTREVLATPHSVARIAWRRLHRSSLPSSLRKILSISAQAVGLASRSGWADARKPR